MREYKGCKKILKTYALYKGDEYICDGNVYDIAKKTGLAEQTIRHYGSKAYKRRVSEEGKRLVLIGKEVVDDYNNY
jgi:hypothetical protein